MMDEAGKQKNIGAESDSYRQRWHKPKPEVLAPPTYWPIIFAVGITLLAWGAVTALPLSLLGLGICVVAVIKWIGDIRRGQQHEIDGK
jgi:hypothetical protein